MRVLALDPGERVGWATGEINHIANLSADPALTVTDHGIAHLKDMALATYRAVVVEKKYDVVVCESYRVSGNPERLRSHIGSEVPTIQFIGMVRLACWIGNVRYAAQGPSALNDADKSLKSGIPGAAEVLALLAKLPKSHDESHDGSALRQLWSFYFANYA